jgi:paraquat-inducible protein B
MAMALGKGLPAVAQTAAASRKEQRAIEQSANEYDLNLAKAQEAAAKGDMDAALNFKKLAQDAKYQQGMLAYHNAALGKPGESMQLLNAIRKPGESLSDAYARMQTLKKPIDVIPRATALKEWGDLMPNEQRKYGTFENYYNTVNSTGGGGNDLQAQASAELARRSKS